MENLVENLVKGVKEEVGYRYLDTNNTSSKNQFCIYFHSLAYALQFTYTILQRVHWFRLELMGPSAKEVFFYSRRERKAEWGGASGERSDKSPKK